MLLLMPLNEYLGRLGGLRGLADIALVFLLVYAVLKLMRGTRAAPMAAGIAAFAFLYWLAVSQNLATLEFVLRGALPYIGVAIVVLFQSEIRQALIAFGNRFRFPFAHSHSGQFGE
jgi:diadenylate cyclase